VVAVGDAETQREAFQYGGFSDVRGTVVRFLSSPTTTPHVSTHSPPIERAFDMRRSYTSGPLAEALVLIGVYWMAAAFAEQQQNPDRFQWRIQQLLPADAPREDADKVLSLLGSDYV
jgi:hypothetical protein